MLRFVRHPQHRAEAARVVVAQERAVVEHDVDVVVQAARRRVREEPQAPRHPEVDRAAIRRRGGTASTCSCDPPRRCDDSRTCFCSVAGTGQRRRPS